MERTGRKRKKRPGAKRTSKMKREKRAQSHSACQKQKTPNNEVVELHINWGSGGLQSDDPQSRITGFWGLQSWQLQPPDLERFLYSLAFAGLGLQLGGCSCVATVFWVIVSGIRFGTIYVLNPLHLTGG